MLVPPLSLGLGLLYGLEGQRTLSSIIGTRVDDCEAKFAGSRQEVLSQDSEDVIIEESCRQKKSCKQLSQEIQQHCGKTRSREVIQLFCQRQGFKTWHEIPEPCKTNWILKIGFGLWISWESGTKAASSIWQWAMNFSFIIRRPNFQNDRIWLLTPDEIPDEERHHELIKSPECVGVFVLFTARQMTWVIKPQVQGWDGDYFQKVLTERIIPFLQDLQNVLDVTQVTFLHNKAPCMKAFWTQNLLKDNNLDFFGNEEWPGNSPDLNAQWLESTITAIMQL